MNRSSANRMFFPRGRGSGHRLGYKSSTEPIVCKLFLRFFLVVCVFTAGLSMVSADDWTPPPYTEKEILGMVIGHTDEEVRNVLGPPDKVYNKDGMEFWRYKHIVVIPGTEDTFARTEVVFVNGMYNHIFNLVSASSGTPEVLLRKWGANVERHQDTQQQ